ncbi:MAG TPA: SMC-Scp complex subunit ScpB [Gammaproteobacteria bacterium]|nr:SMC-Scp complex subunit ScpB [Gammaproteobacteria bacterium]
MTNQQLKNIIEGFLFASEKTLNIGQLIKMFPVGEEPEKDDVQQALNELASDFETHGIELKQVSSGYRFQVREKYTQHVSRLWEEKPQKYTRALLETLALIVYRQPITRGEIEEIRGVAVSSNIIRTLQEREWVKIVGHRDVPGRPALFASTKQFLDYFNLQSLEDLPPLSEIKDLDAIATDLDPEQNEALLSAIRKMQEAQNPPEDAQAGALLKEAKQNEKAD